MNVERLAIPDVVLLHPQCDGDARGYCVETVTARAFRDAVTDADLVQDSEAGSASAGTVRGLHFQRPPAAQAKTVRVPRGAIIDVAVGIRTGSHSFGHAATARLDAAQGTQVSIPPGFAHGYCTLEPDTVVTLTAFCEPASEGGMLWNDPAPGMAWPMRQGGAQLSQRDLALPPLAELPAIFGAGGAPA